MASERKSGAGNLASGVLERLAPPRPAPTVEPDDVGEPVEPESTRGRGATTRKDRASAARPAKRAKAHTIYLADDLFERIMVQAHRKNKTISEYVAAILERQVPDYRTSRADPAVADDAA